MIISGQSFRSRLLLKQRAHLTLGNTWFRPSRPPPLPSSLSMSSLSMTSTQSTVADTEKQHESKRLINLLRGWPSPQLLPIAQLRSAAERVLTDPSVAVPALQYAPDPGYQPLRAE